MSRMLLTRGGGDHGLLIDLAHRRGFRVHVRGVDLYEVTKNNKCCFRGTAAEVHRWLRSKVAA
jgi:hypothetical protein